MKSVVIGLVITALGSILQAQSVILLPEDQNLSEIVQIGGAQISGVGCGGAASAVLQKDGDLVFMVGLSANKPKKAALDRKACSLALPIQLAPGFKLTAKKIELRGTTSIQKGAKIKISSEVFSAGAIGDKINIELAPTSSIKKSIRTSQAVSADKSELVSCGGSTNLRINASVISMGVQKSVLTKVDVIEVSTQLEKCN